MGVLLYFFFFFFVKEHENYSLIFSFPYFLLLYGDKFSFFPLFSLFHWLCFTAFINDNDSDSEHDKVKGQCNDNILILNKFTKCMYVRKKYPNVCRH